MLVTTTLLSQFSGTYPESTDLQEIYIGTATQIINDYVGFNCESTDKWTEVPAVFKFVCLEIATLMQQEESQNLGINSKSFGDGGTRSFLNVVDYSKYLKRLDSYRTGDALKL